MESDEDDLFDNLADGAFRFGAGGLGGLLIGMLGNVIRAELGFKPKAETIVAIPTTAIGIGTARPELVGGGLGLIVSDILCDVNTWAEAADIEDVKGTQESDWFIQRYDIPNWLPEPVVYRMLGDVLTDMVKKPSKNVVKGKMVPAGREHPDVIKLARQIVAEAGISNGRDFPQVARAIQVWVHDNIGYVRDPRWMDTFAHPYRTLQEGREDCDGHSLLVCSLIEALGAPTALVIYDQNGFGRGYNHITGALKWKGQLYPLETVNQQAAAVPWGWWPPHYRKMVFNIGSS